MVRSTSRIVVLAAAVACAGGRATRVETNLAEPVAPGPAQSSPVAEPTVEPPSVPAPPIVAEPAEASPTRAERIEAGRERVLTGLVTGEFGPIGDKWSLIDEYDVLKANDPEWQEFLIEVPDLPAAAIIERLEGVVEWMEAPSPSHGPWP